MNERERYQVPFILFLFIFLSAAEAAPMSYKLDGRVLRVDESSRMLYVEFTHPATGEVSEKVFTVPQDCGFKNVKGLGKLNAGDLVSAEYLPEGEMLKAIYIEHVPTAELAMTTPGEVAKTLFQIKSNEKKNAKDASRGQSV